jgi:hypothetical protein
MCPDKSVTYVGIVQGLRPKAGLFIQVMKMYYEALASYHTTLKGRTTKFAGKEFQQGRLSI